MSIDIAHTLTRADDEILIKVSGKFDFNSREEFAYVAGEIKKLSPPQKIRFDFSRADYIDSSAIGFLFKLHDDLGESYPRMKVAGARGHVKEIFEAVMIHYLFDVVHPY